ncbi:MAG: hypothetical protein QW472_01300 [Candidatus Aenigmatarchaeota archaeon]
MSEYQENLDRLTKELFSRKMSRRDFLALTTAQAASLATGAFLAGGLVGYLLGRQAEPRTITQTKTETLTKTQERTTTSTTTATTTSTLTKTETKTSVVRSPVIQKIGKSYSVSNREYEIDLLIGTEAGVMKRVEIFSQYPSGVEEKVPLLYSGRRRMEINGKEEEMVVFEGRFYTKEFGTHNITLEVESEECLVARKISLVDIGLSNDDLKIFENMGGSKGYLNKIWQAYLSDLNLRIDREKAFREIFSILLETSTLNGNDESVLYLKELASYALSNKKENLVEVYGKEALKTVLDVINTQPILITGLSKNYDPPKYQFCYSNLWEGYPMPLQGEEFEILTFIAQDNEEYVIKYPYITWAITKQVKGLKDRFHGFYSNYLSEQGKPRVTLEYSKVYEIQDPNTKEVKKISVRKIVNKQFSNLDKIIKSGKYVLGPSPQDLLEVVGEVKNKELIADTWQRQRCFPFVHLPSASMLHGNWAYNIYPEVIDINPLVRLIILEENVNHLLEINNKTLDVIKKGDNSYLIDFFNWYTSWAKNSPPQAQKDFKILYEKGSEIVKSQQRIYNYALKKTFEELKLPLGDEEWRVECYVVSCASVLLPGVRMASWFGKAPGFKEGIKDGQAGLTLTQKDVELLYSIDEDELNLEKNYFNSLPAVVTRVTKAKEDGIIESDIALFSNYSQIYRRF